MPVQLVLLFVALAAVDLACQVLGALLAYHVPALARDAARLGSAVFLSAVMIVAYRFGPEASIAAVAVSLGASAAWAWFAISTGAWRRRRRAFATR